MPADSWNDNRIHENKYLGVRVYKQEGGTVEGNDLSGNEDGSFYISDDSESNVVHKNNQILPTPYLVHRKRHLDPWFLLVEEPGT